MRPRCAMQERNAMSDGKNEDIDKQEGHMHGNKNKNKNKKAGGTRGTTNETQRVPNKRHKRVGWRPGSRVVTARTRRTTRLLFLSLDPRQALRYCAQASATLLVVRVLMMLLVCVRR